MKPHIVRANCNTRLDQKLICEEEANDNGHEFHEYILVAMAIEMKILVMAPKLPFLQFSYACSS